MALTFEPYIPLALWLPLAIAAAALLAWYGAASRRRVPAGRRLAVLGLMGLAAALPLGVLLNPTWIESLPPPPGKPLITILVDASASMATSDVEGKPRLTQAVATAQRAAAELDDRYEVRVRAFDEATSPSSATELALRAADGPATDLAAAIHESLEDRPQGQALFVLSDGGHNASALAAVRDSALQAKSLATPVFTQTLGALTGVSDIDVRLHLPQELAFVRQETPVAVTIQQRGHLTDEVSLSLLLDGEPIARQTVEIGRDSTAEAVFPISREARGLYRFEVQAKELPGEATTLNNSAPLVLRVIDEPVRVLLLEGKPYWDTKFLVRTLSADASIELVSVVRLAEGRFLRRTVSHERPSAEASEEAGETGGGNGEVAIVADATARLISAPRREDWIIETDASHILADAAKLAEYQIVVLGRDSEVYLSDEAVTRLRKWLMESDGSLVCFRGPPASQLNQRLGDLIPVQWSPAREHRFRVRLTQDGQALRWLAGGDDEALENLPSLSSATQPERPKPLAVVLATTGGGVERRDPVITYQPVGSGRVVVVEGSGMWRWAFLSPEHQQHDEVYRVLWRSLVRWLVSSAELLPSQQMALRADKVTFDASETATGTLLVRDAKPGEAPTVELAGSSLAEPQAIVPIPSGDAPGQFRVVFGKLPEGRYEARIAGADPADAAARAVFDVRGFVRERLDVAARPDLMRLLAEESGGAVLQEASGAEIARLFDAHLAAALPRRTMRTTAWDRWWVLGGLLAAWGATWALRRGSGLV